MEHIFEFIERLKQGGCVCSITSGRKVNFLLMLPGILIQPGRGPLRSQRRGCANNTCYVCTQPAQTCATLPACQELHVLFAGCRVRHYNRREINVVSDTSEAMHANPAKRRKTSGEPGWRGVWRQWRGQHRMAKERLNSLFVCLVGLSCAQL